MAGISNYLIPPSDAKEDLKLRWLAEAFQEGTRFLKGQRAYEDLDRAIDMIAGLDDDRVPDSLSSVYSNRLKRQLREVVATMANLRPLWGYVSDNEEYKDHAEVLNKLVYAWWLNTFADRSIRQAIQWACISTGYVSPVWDRDFWVTGRGDIKLNVYGPRDILPIQIGRDHDLQKAYAVIIQEEVPLARCRVIYPEYADRIKPDRDSPSWFTRRIRKAVPKFASPVFDSLFGEKEEVTTSGPIVDVFNTYILDHSINKTDKPIRMGDPGTSWEYEVPFLGQDIPAGKTLRGDIVYRKATPSDCMLYPLRRLMTATRTVVFRDGTSPWWHGKVPLVRFTVDDWPNEYLGFSLVRDVHSLQRSLNRHLRGMDDMVEKALRPDQLYDPNIISKNEIERMDPRIPGRRIPVNMSMGKGLEISPAPEIPPYIPAHIEMLKAEIDHLLAIRDMTNLAKANQIPSSESIDRLLEMAGPVVTDISRGMERSLRDLGELVKSYFYQFYTAPRKVQILGKGGLSEEDFYFEPGALIPSKLKEQQFMDTVLPNSMEAAKRAKDSCIFHITPNSLHQIQQMSRKLLYLQLWRDGRFPIDPETVAEALDIPNFGSLPGGESNTVLDRYIQWMKIQLQMQIQAQQAMGQAQMEMQSQMAQSGLAGLAQQAAGAAGKPNGQERPGRPPSGQKAPELKTKDGGQRTVITEA